MNNLLEKIRNKPEKEKMKILIVSTIIIMTVILSVWGINSKQNIEISSEEKESISFFKSLNTQLDSIKNLF